MLWNKTRSTKYKTILQPTPSFIPLPNDKWFPLRGLEGRHGTFGTKQTWRNGMGWPEEHGRTEERTVWCDTFLTILSVLERKAGKIQSSASCQFKFSKYARETRSRIECWRESYQKEKWKCPNSQSNIAKRVPGNMVAKSYWVNSRLLYQDAKRNRSLCHCEKGVLGAPTTLINFQAFWSPSFLTLKRQFHMEVFPSWGRKH